MANNERERRMSMLRAALPYTMGTQRHALEMLLQADSLVNIARRRESDLEACDYDGNPEEMLLHIQEYCTPRETDMVQMILNFMKANHLFQNYREFMASYSDHAPADDLQAASLSRAVNNPLATVLQLFGGFGGSGNSNHLMEFLLSQLSPDQKQFLEQLQGLSSGNVSSQTPPQTQSFSQAVKNPSQDDTFPQNGENPSQDDMQNGENPSRDDIFPQSKENQSFIRNGNRLISEDQYHGEENDLAVAELPLNQE